MNNKWIITHPSKAEGYDPHLTIDGVRSIESLHKLVVQIPKPPLIVIGMGRRYYETYSTLLNWLKDIPICYSPFCGGANSLESNGMMAIASAVIPQASYLGLIESPGFNPWDFISGFSEDTLFFSGRELMYALKLSDITKGGRVYQVNPETKSGHEFFG